MNIAKAKLTFDENVLIRKIQNGQTALFAELTERYQDRLYSLAYRFVNDSETASELVQETFMRALKGIDQFHGNSQFYTWLVRILINCTNSWRSREQHHHQTIENMQNLLLGSQARSLMDANPAKQAEVRELTELLWRSIDMLDNEHKQILLLKNQQNLSYAEIAQVLKISEGTVKSRLFRAREKLRELMFDKLEENTENTDDT